VQSVSEIPLVETTRGGMVESVHIGSIAVVDAAGVVSWSVGNPRLRTFPRSSLKPFQLLTLVARGGIARFGFTAAEVAVMAASHSGEPIHVATVSSVLGKVDAPPSALVCGVQAPGDVQSAERLAGAGQAPTALHNNCSGKHAGMLALTRLLGAPLDGYVEPDHPAQRAVRECLVDVLQLDPADLPVGVDGCSAPAYAVALDKMARGFALLGQPDQASTRWAAGLRTIAEAMRAHPELVGGTRNRVDTDLMRLGKGLVAKGGAEGYFCIGHPDGRGLALKILDGDGAQRARPVAAAMAARRLGWLAAHDLGGPLSGYGPAVPIHNWAGRRTGHVRPAAALAEEAEKETT